jgi:hypothetical protein
MSLSTYKGHSIDLVCVFPRFELCLLMTCLCSGHYLSVASSSRTVGTLSLISGVGPLELLNVENLFLSVLFVDFFLSVPTLYLVQ